MATKIIFFGNERLATGTTTTAPILQALVAAGYQIAAVVVSQGDPAQSRKNRILEIATVADSYNIPLLSPVNLGEVKDELAGFDAEIGVLVAYGNLVPQAIIDIFPRGIVNIHPSLLPKHRGSTPIESVIMSSERETGVSLMQLVSKMDAGPVYAQQRVPLSGNETKQALANQLLELGKNVLLANLPKILDGSLKPTPQNDSLATHDKIIDKSDSELDATKPAKELERQVRAYAGWPRSRIKLGTTEVIVTKAHVINIAGTAGTLWLDDKQLGVHCSEDTLVIDALIPPGKKEMSATAFLAGYNPQAI